MLNELRFVLLAAGLVLAFLELKIPGFGLAGILSIACFTLLFTARYLVGLADIPPSHQACRRRRDGHIRETTRVCDEVTRSREPDGLARHMECHRLGTIESFVHHVRELAPCTPRRGPNYSSKAARCTAGLGFGRNPVSRGQWRDAPVRTVPLAASRY